MTTPIARKKPITLHRTLAATLDEVWELWTTKDGIESWWGPDGFAVKVQELDVRPGGTMRYTMNAVAPEMVAFMKSSGMPTSTPHQVTFLEVIALRLLVMESPADFIPGVEPYATVTRAEFSPVPSGVQLTMVLEAMHDAVWTERMTMGWDNELTKLERIIQSRK